MIDKKRAEIHRAFKTLENAIQSKEAEARQKASQSDYSALVSNLVSHSFQTAGSSIEKIDDLVSSGQAFVQLALIKANKALDRNPWVFVGKVALGSFGIGLILGSRYRNSRSRARK